MNIKIIWYAYVVLLVTAMMVALPYLAMNKKLSKIWRIILSALILLICMLGIHLFITHIITHKGKWQLPTKTIPLPLEAGKEPLPIEKEFKINEYLKSIDKNRPIVIGAPREVSVRFTDPVSPNSPHAIFQMVSENKGNQSAKDIDIKWDIKDIGGQGRRITPPDEWARIIGKKKEIYSLAPGMGFLQIYGPEIGAYAQKEHPNIEVIVSVTYKDTLGKEYSYYCKSKTITEESKDRRYFFEIIEVK